MRRSTCQWKIRSGRAWGDTPKGTNRAQMQIFADSRRFSLILAFSWKAKHLGNADFRRKPQILAGKPQKTAGTLRKPQIGVCPLRFVPLKRRPKKGFQWNGGRHSVNEGFGKDFYRKGKVWAIQWTVGHWKLKSCCPHPLPENQLFF